MQSVEINVTRSKLRSANYLMYLDRLGLSERDKDVVRKYDAGKTIKELSKEFSVSYNRIQKIVLKVIKRCKEM